MRDIDGDGVPEMVFGTADGLRLGEAGSRESDGAVARPHRVGPERSAATCTAWVALVT